MPRYKYNGLTVKLSDLHAFPTESMYGRRRVWQLTQPFYMSVEADSSHDTMIVPKGFRTDFATVPLFAQLLIGGRDDPGVAEAAVIHDWCCVNDYPREYTNTKMWCLMLALGVSRWKATAIYGALMFFGYKSPVSRLWKWAKRWADMET